MRPEITENKNVSLTMLDDIIHSGYSAVCLIPYGCPLPHITIERCFLVGDLEKLSNSVEASTTYFKTYTTGIKHEIEMLPGIQWSFPGHSKPCIEQWYVMQDTVPPDDHICCFKSITNRNAQFRIIDSYRPSMWLHISAKRRDVIAFTKIMETTTKDPTP